MQVRVHLVVVAYHKMLTPDMQRDILGRLTVFERKLAEDKLGQVHAPNPCVTHSSPTCIQHFSCPCSFTFLTFFFLNHMDGWRKYGVCTRNKCRHLVAITASCAHKSMIRNVAAVTHLCSNAGILQLLQEQRYGLLQAASYQPHRERNCAAPH
jgi:hypothetical protein